MSEPPKRLRRRPPKSCEPCRQRKIRCDLELPCSACKRSRPPRSCSYRPTSPGPGGEGVDDDEDASSITLKSSGSDAYADDLVVAQMEVQTRSLEHEQAQVGLLEHEQVRVGSLEHDQPQVGSLEHPQLRSLDQKPQSKKRSMPPTTPARRPKKARSQENGSLEMGTPMVGRMTPATASRASVAVSEDEVLVEREKHEREVRDLRERIRRMEEMLERQSHQNQHQSHHQSHRQSHHQSHQSHHQRQHQHQQYQHRQQNAQPKSHPLSAPQQQHIQQKQSHHQNNPQNNEVYKNTQKNAPSPPPPLARLVPRLRNAPNKTRLFGPVHWLYTAEQFSLVGQFDPMEVEPDLGDAKADLLALFNGTRSLRVKVKARNRARLTDPVADLLDSLPDRKTCDELLDAYLRTFEPMYRIMHIPTLKRDYDQFWNEKTNGTTTTGANTASPAPPLPTHFSMKLVTMLAIGVTFWATDDDESKRLKAVAQRWVYAAQWWLTGPTEKASMNMDGLQLACLVLLARRTIWNGPGGNGPGSSSGALLNMAMSMGLHRSVAMFRNLGVFEREMRARLWVTVLELCLQTSMDGATPLLISSGDYDAAAPLNINDVDIEPGQRDEPDVRDGLTDCSLQILQAESLPLRLEIQRRLDALEPQADEEASPYDAALKLGNKMKAACRDVAVFFRKHTQTPTQPHNHQPHTQPQNTQPHQSHNQPQITQSQTTPPSPRTCSLAPREFHRRLIELAFRRYVLLLHRPFMVEARREPRYYLARKVCVESATIMASYARDIEPSMSSEKLQTSSSLDLSRLAVVGHGLFKGPLSMDAIAILALEVITQLEEHHHHSTPLSPSLDTCDALDELHRSERAPLVAVLETVQDRLMGLIERGSLSLKRFGYTAALLAQIRAMESGQPSIRRAVYNALMEYLGKAHALLLAGLEEGDGERTATATFGQGFMGVGQLPQFQPQNHIQHHHHMHHMAHQMPAQHAGDGNVAVAAAAAAVVKDAGLFGGGEDMFAMFDFPLDVTGSWGAYVPNWGNWWPGGFSGQ